ncbi:MAG TPA: DUF87 domain-containing protein [Kofleriaceae bacterium]|nr:DUF87 domain-containing protein [Kofleriaceae bacterium]
MTQPLTVLDGDELTHWLTHLTQTVDRSLREPVRGEATAALRDGLDAHDKVRLPVLIQLAFLSDCLHVAHLAIDADGKLTTDELIRVTDLVRVAASKYFFALPAYESFDDSALATDDVARFLRVHREDSGPFGFRRSEEWRGLALARLVERTTRDASPLRDHERMLIRIMETVFAGGASAAEQLARRRLRDLFEAAATGDGADPRAVAFCRGDGPEVFSSISHGGQFHDRDPFDIEAIHADARAVFHQQIDRATTPEQARRGQGRMLLVLGASGAGKTHLLRALRAQVHRNRLGYVGYLQLAPDLDDYPRVVLRKLIDSLEAPYDAPALAESGLMYLSDGLAEGRVAIPPDDLERLRTAELAPDQLEALVGRLVDHVVRTDGLERLEVDLVHALLLLQRRDPALQRRVVRFLRCEALTHYDRQLLGGIAARDRAEDPLRTIQQLATLMHELQLAALVIVVDQIEDVVSDGRQPAPLQRALDAMRAIADAIPSAVVVLSCLQDVYDAVKPRLSQSLVDRLERDQIRLISERTPDEIEHMLTRRLEHLYHFFDVAWRDDDPLFPFVPAQIAAVTGFRTRDCLGKFREFHARCIAARAIVHGEATPPPARPEPAAPAPAPAIDSAWAQAIERAAIPDDDAALLALVGDAVRGAAIELDLDVRLSAAPGGELILDGKRRLRRMLALCNQPPQRGSLGNQLAGLRAAASKAHAAPIALRTGEVKFLPKSKSAQHVGELIAARGLLVALTEAQLRVAAAARAMHDAPPDGFLAWRKAKQPLSALPFVRQLLDLDRAHEDPDDHEAPAPPPPAPPRPAPSPPPVAPPAAPPPAPPSDAIRLGVVDSLRADPILLGVEDLKTHMAFLGGTGSGKTTAALSVIEQLLERSVSVIMVDRKGDLARYVSDAWWRDPSAPPAIRARKLALRERLQLALFTPGNAHGRPLRLPLVPSLADVKPQDREQLARYAADGLAAMMGYSAKSATHKAKAAILQCAIVLHGDARDITLELLLETISRPDPELLHSVGALQRHFASLAEDLQSLLIQRGSLLSGEGEPLDVAALLPPPNAGRASLSIINTAALSELPVQQFWVSRLLVEISRLGRKRPSPVLQAVAFLDEADEYIPVNRVPPTKEPIFDLLRRARSTGIGLLLATQNPGDLDYKARDNISTWLLGRIAQDTAIAKMRNLIGAYPDVGPRLAQQRTGSFFLLTGTTKRELKADRSLMETVQLPEAEVAELARATR